LTHPDQSLSHCDVPFRLAQELVAAQFQAESERLSFNRDCLMIRTQHHSAYRIGP